jgi:hypothetical protein
VGLSTTSVFFVSLFTFPGSTEAAIAKNRNTYAKRQREQDKKYRADKKREKKDRKREDAGKPVEWTDQQDPAATADEMLTPEEPQQ